MNELEAVSLHDERELRRSEGAIYDPVWQLIVPDAVMAAELLPGFLHEVRNDVPVLESEHAGLGFGIELPSAYQ